MSAPLAVTAGEPAGIGPDLCIALARSAGDQDFVVVSDAALLRERAIELGATISVTGIAASDIGARRSEPGELLVVDLPYPEKPVCGQLNKANSQTLLDGLALAVDGCLDGRFAGVVTAPVQKSIINDAMPPAVTII